MATSEIYTFLHTLSLHDALPIWCPKLSTSARRGRLRSVTGSSVSSAHGISVSAAFLAPEMGRRPWRRLPPRMRMRRSEEHTSELQSLMRISYAVFCLKKKQKVNG